MASIVEKVFVVWNGNVVEEIEVTFKIQLDVCFVWSIKIVLNLF